MHEDHDCEEVFSQLSAFLDGELGKPSCEELARHMTDCEPCQRYLESLRATRESLRSLGSEVGPSPEEVDRALKECLDLLRRNP